jgi:hypothetical protein
MKKVINILMMGTFLIGTSVFAQEEENNKEDLLNELKMEYIEEAIGLSSEEQLAFEKVYEDYELKRKELRLEQRKEIRAVKKSNSAESEAEISEEDAKKILMMKFENQREMMALEEEYTNKMIETFSAKKVLEYEKAEREFKRELLKMLKDDKPQHEMRNELRQKRRPQGTPKTN